MLYIVVHNAYPQNIPNEFSVTHIFIVGVVVSKPRGIMNNVMGIFHALSLWLLLWGRWERERYLDYTSHKTRVIRMCCYIYTILSVKSKITLG